MHTVSGGIRFTPGGGEMSGMVINEMLQNVVDPGPVAEEETLGWQFEREFLRIVLELAERRTDLNLSELARRSFPSLVDPIRALRRIRKTEKKGRPQGLRLMDAFHLAQAVSDDVPYVFYLAYRALAEKSRKNHPR